jgi:transcriptional regulator with XRE-family HTH domain
MGNRIKNIRRYHNLTQAAFARSINVDQTAVSNWENGKNSIDVQTAKNISELYLYSLEFIYGYDYSLKSSPSTWPLDLYEDYCGLDSLRQECFLFRNDLITFNEYENEKPPADIGEELSEGQRKLIEFARSVPEDKIDLILKVMQSIVEAD